MDIIRYTHLHNLADEAAKEEEPSIDFPLPDECDTTGLKLMEIKDVQNKGKGFHAKQDLSAGALLLVSKPKAIIMGWEEDEFYDDEEEEEEIIDESMDDDNNEDLVKSNRRNGVLTIRIAKAIKQNPSLWFDEVSKLFPRDANSLPVWVCEHDETGMEFERSINELETKDEFKGERSTVIEEIRQRLPFIVKYNCLSVETSPELFSYPDQNKGGHINLSATALYNEPSYFNHSHKPNVSRWSIGDIIFFVANQNVKAGTELCISYIESELLCENSKRRSTMLEMDFKDLDDIASANQDTVDDDNGDDDDAEGPVISLDVQDELMSMHQLSRLDEINRLLRLSTGQSNEDDMGEGEDEIQWFQCDTHRLRTLLALTYESLGQSNKALEEWKKCIEFATKNLPPADEAGTALYVQSALCAIAAGQESVAKEYAAVALSNHELIFGGGVEFFRKRYAKEMDLGLRTSKKALSGQAALDALWPI